MNEQAGSKVGRWSVAAGAVAILGLLLVGCGDGPSEGSAPGTTRVPAATVPATTATTATPVSPPGTATTTGSPPVPTTQPPERLTDASRLRLDGIGAIRVGMTLEQAEAASSTDFRASDASQCTYARPVNGPAGLAFMLNGGLIVRVDVGMGVGGSPSDIATLSGIRIGSSEGEVQSTYRGKIIVQGHPYLPTGHYLVYNPDPANAQYGLIFETDGQRVTSFRSGFAAQVQWTEGCS